MKKRNELLWKDDLASVEPLLVDVKVVEKMLGVCERTIRTLTKSGELPVVKIASRVLYSVEDLIAFVRQRSTRMTEGKSEQIDFVPSATGNPLEWVIPVRNRTGT